MRAFPAAFFSFLSLFAFPVVAKAVSISELPATIQSCITAGSCSVDTSASYDSGTASAFSMIDFASGQINWLVRYGLVPPSGQTDISGAQTSTYGGYLWMQVAINYSVAEAAHPVTLFVDKVSSAPGSIFGQGGDLSFYMTSTDLLAGGGYNTTSYVSYDENGIVSTGGVSGDILLCLAVGCQSSVQLNLVQLKYQDLGPVGIHMTGFDASDKRGLIFSQSSSYITGDPYSDYSITESFYVSAVPEPRASWLFGFGVLPVLVAARNRNRRDATVR